VSRPKLSVVVVLFREQGYVRDCLASILEQSFRDVELLVLDNGSPDHGPEILVELAERDARLTVQRLETPVSLGEARNRAVEQVGGDYVWFFSTTDRLPPGSLALVSKRLEEIEPDLLVVDHVREDVLGARTPGRHSVLIHAAPPTGCFALSEFPDALELGVEVRDKVFRRAFLEAGRLRFALGRGGHLPLTYGGLLTARRIGVLPHPCLTRLDPPNAADEAIVHGNTFDVLEQFDAVFRLVDDRLDRSAPERRLLLRSMRRYCLGLLTQLPASSRRTFFGQLSTRYRRYGGGEPPGGGLRPRLEAWLLARDRYRSFRAFQWAYRRRRALRRRLGAGRRFAWRLAGAGRRAFLTVYYRVQLRARLDPHLAVFAAYWYRGYACNPRAVYEKLRELLPEVRGVWVVEERDSAKMPAGVEHVVAGTRAYYRLMARATYFVNNVGFPDDIVKRRGTVRVHTHHGTPLKTMGLDLRSAFFAGPRMDFGGQLRRLARWDYSVSQNAFSTVIWERVYPGRYETLEVGYPRNDALVNARAGDVTRARAELGIEADRVAVLYAPTHREYLRPDLPPLKVGRLAEALGPDYVILSRAHYLQGQEARDEGPDLGDGILDVTAHPTIEDLFLAADVLITDYSSVMFDYAVLDRPVVIHAPDWDVYRTLRGTYFDLLAEPPGVVATTDEELLAAFRSGAVWGEEAARLRAVFRARFCYLDDGHAAERVVRKVWFGQDPFSPRAPSAEARSQMRRLLPASEPAGDRSAPAQRHLAPKAPGDRSRSAG
jgi:CDP-glycerol glycerophosphotransferase